MATRVADAGHELTVWGRTPARTVGLAERGARVAPAPSEAIGGAEVVVVTVADPDALADVVFGRHGVATTIAPPATVIEMSTVGPDAVGRLRTALPAGVAMLDAPVLGSVAEAEAGTLTVLVGGPADVVDRWRTLVAVLGDVVYVGPSGSGAAAKQVGEQQQQGPTEQHSEHDADDDEQPDSKLLATTIARTASLFRCEATRSVSRAPWA